VVVPALSGLDPASATAGQALTLTVQGSQFLSGAQVLVDGVAYAAIFVSGAELRVSLPALAAATYSISVLNPGAVPSSNSASLMLAGPAATATPSQDGPLVIEQAAPWPNPNPQWLALKLAGPAERVTLKVYTPSWALLGQVQMGPLAKGWRRLPLPSELASAPRGLYYFYAVAEDQGRRSAPLRGRFYCWR
jgi:hypothetical protein